MSDGVRRFAWLRAAGALALALGVASAAGAQSPTLISPDITAPLGTIGPVTITDDDHATDDGAGTVTSVLPATLAAVPPNAEIAGLELSTSMPPALALDVTTPLPGLLVPAEPRDVVHWNSITYSLLFDGSANGVPAGVRVDAVSYSAAGLLLLSFDTTVALPGLGAVDDEDLVSWAPGPVYALVFDGSANGIAPGLDLDAASRLVETADILLLSFDASGVTPGGLLFDDEDTLVFDPGLGTYAMYADASLSDPVDYPPVDVIALPEPGAAAGLAAALALLALLARRARAA